MLISRDELMTATTHARTTLARIGLAALAAVLVFVWLANSSGLLSSNDGSHLALARALVLRGETSIDSERALTLDVDLALRDGHAYSDRPPGTAFAALPAVWLGDRLDPWMLERAIAQARAGQDVDPLPGAHPYLTTYAKRAPPDSPRLVALIGTALAISCHAAAIGLLGLLLLDALLRRLGFDVEARLFALASLGLASAWGPYASALFSHVSAATAVAGFMLGVVELARTPDGERRAWVAALTGLAGAWAIACEYTLLLALVPAAALAVRRRQWPWLLLGSVPIAAATLAYHHAAFGSPFALGYDYQRNFAFARTRGSTFSGNLLDGLWTLWGLGRGAGLLAQSPIALLGLAASPLLTGSTRTPAHVALVRVLLCFVPWLLVLAMHRTPWGGGTEDHRYLIPLLPFAAVGLALAWTRASWPWRVGLLVLTGVSALLVWRHFLAWHEASAFAHPWLGAGAGVIGFAVVALSTVLRQKLGRRDASC